MTHVIRPALVCDICGTVCRGAGGMANHKRCLHEGKARDLGMAVSEKQLQNEVTQWLALAVPNAQVFQFGKPGGRPHCPKCGTVAGRLAGATPSGWPDLVIMMNGWADIFIELKTERGKTTELQERCHDNLRSVGRSVHVCRSVRDVYKALVNGGIRPRLGPG